MKEFSEILYSKDGSLGIITINREYSNNRINRLTGNEIVMAIQEANEDKTVKVIILTAVGEYFCGGGEIDNYPEGPIIDQLLYTDSFWSVHEAMNRSKKPILGAVQGHAIAGGFSIVDACDMAVAGKSCLFGMPEIERALFPMVALATTSKTIPKKRLLEICYTAKRIDAQTALQLNLVNQVVENEVVLTKTKEIASEIARYSGAALMFGRETYYRMSNMSIGNAMEYGRAALLGMLCTEDAKEYGFAKLKGTVPEIKNI